MAWTVLLHPRVAKVLPTLPLPVQDLLQVLLLDMEALGPVRGNWPHYSKLPHAQHHCHLKKGRPTYIVVWAVRDRRQRLLEVLYVGTHENGPY